MAEKETVGSRLKDVFVDVTSRADTGIEHAVVGAVVGAGILFKEGSAAMRQTAEVSGRVGKGVAKVVYEKATHRLR